jgi:hypothetical protein
MTQAVRAWRKANTHVRAANHAKAIYWLCRTQATLDADRPGRKGHHGMDTGYMFAAAFFLLVLWVVNG